MGTEQEDNAVAELESPEVQEPTVEQLKADLAQAQGEAEKYKKDYSGLQASHQKAVEEGRITQGLQETLNGMKARFDELEMNDAILLDRSNQPTDEYSQTPSQPNNLAVMKLQEERAKRQTEQQAQAVTDLQNQLFYTEAEKYGINPHTDEDFKDEVIRTSSGPEDGRLKIAPFAEKRKLKLQADKEKADAEQQVLDEAKQKRDDAVSKGELDPVTPSTGGAGESQKLKRGDVSRLTREAKNPQELIAMLKGKEFDY